ncbi:MAG: dihydroorotate dehydrogenase B catalytic subunit [Nitrospirae bacterium GWC2_57_13]|nr:MAG: dihydroorotate dehydrogenase B catalytic subunit [Nitrospirae bacterium GWC2_57_13]OGW41484.1 MAG: dihydroorotate dehydrogenase B catalytic subunit [Nitrospirae bacterium GWD2_57_8]
MGSPDLSVEFAGIKLKNPVLTASGTFGYGEEYAEFVDLNKLGGVIVKGISLKPLSGNPPPRIWETPSGMLNAIGLENPGVDVFLRNKLPFLRQFDTKVIVNIFGYTVEEYAALAERLDDAEGIAGLEVNISCPNVKAGGMVFGTDPATTHELLTAVRSRTKLPIFAKLSPNVTDVTAFARVARDAGCDGLSLINTLLGMAIDVRTGRPRLANCTGGLSGPAIRPVAVRMVWQTAKCVPLPIIGMGGIVTAEDALEFIIAGASAVAVGTANFLNPRATLDVLSGIEEFLALRGVKRLDDLKGTVNTT